MSSNLVAPLRLLLVFFILIGVCVVTVLLESLSLVFVRPLSLKQHRRIVTLVSHGFLLVGSFLLQHWARIRLVTHGDHVPLTASALCIVNHCSSVDWLVGLAWLSRLGFPAPGNAKAVVKASLGQVPIFGWALRLSEFVFLARSWERDQQRFVSALRSLGTFRATGHPLWLILFPEGSRLTSDKLANSQKYSRVNGFPVFDHVLLPRFKGFQALMPELRRHIEYVVDGTLIFDGPKPSMTTVMNGTADIVIHVNIRKYPVAEIPEDEQAMQDWLLQRWVEKESLIAGFLRDPLSLGPPCDPERDAPPSVAPLYTLFAIFVSLAIPILYAVSQIENGMRNLMIANLAIVVMVGGFIASNLRPSRKGKQS